MNRRLVYTLALLSLGLMVGVVIGRFIVPERFGIVTTILLFSGGVAAGAIGLRAWSVWRGTRLDKVDAQPFAFTFRLGARSVTVRWDETWWDAFEKRWFGARDARGGWWDAHWADVETPNARVVVGALALAIVAQILILGSLLAAGLVLYAAAGIVLMVWLWRERISLFHLVSAARIGRRAEIVLLILILLVAFAARMIQAGEHPVGIDGDELKWTAQIYYDFIVQERTGDFSGQQKYTPTSFYLDKVAFDLFGVDFNSPRVFTALLSVVATFVFYFVVRDMFNVAIALMATLLMATSFWDVNTSRQAVVQTFTKLPMILALFLVIRGVDRQRWFYFLLCGIVLYIGVMTYDTFFVVPPVIVLYVLFRGALDWRKWYRWLLYLTMVIAPMLLAYPIVADTIAGRQYTYVKGVGTGISDLLSDQSLTPIINNTLKSFAALFQVLQGADYALDWAGPLLNPLLLPFVVLGFALVLARFWQRHNFLLILSFVVCFFPAPILSGYTVPRVFYIGLPPLFVFAAVGIAAVVAAVLSLGQGRVMMARAVAAGAVALLLLVAVSDGYIYATQLKNRDDWVKRRSLISAVQDSISSAPFTLIPVTRSPDDYVWGNAAVMRFIAYTARPEKNINERYAILHFAELPGALGSIASEFDRVNVLYDIDMNNGDALAASTIQTLKRCYGNIETYEHGSFDVYTIERDALASPRCYSLTSLEAALPNPDQPVVANQPITFEWEADSKRPTAFHLQVEQRDPRLVWIEGEYFPRDNDWMFEAKRDHYPDFSGDGYILDAERAGETRLNAEILTAGNYQVWVRSIRNAREGHQSFLQVGDAKFEFARGDMPLGAWYWEKIGEVNLAAGAAPITLSRVYGKEGWKPVLVDAIFLSAAPDFDPEADDLWTQALDTGQIESAETRYVLEKGLPPGAYRWRVQLSDGNRLVDASGKRGVWSDKVEFRVQ